MSYSKGGELEGGRGHHSGTPSQLPAPRQGLFKSPWTWHENALLLSGRDFQRLCLLGSSKSQRRDVSIRISTARCCHPTPSLSPSLLGMGGSGLRAPPRCRAGPRGTRRPECWQSPRGACQRCVQLIVSDAGGVFPPTQGLGSQARPHKPVFVLFVDKWHYCNSCRYTLWSSVERAPQRGICREIPQTSLRAPGGGARAGLPAHTGPLPARPALGHPLRPGAGRRLGSGGLAQAWGRARSRLRPAFGREGQPRAQRPLRGAPPRRS